MRTQSLNGFGHPEPKVQIGLLVKMRRRPGCDVCAEKGIHKEATYDGATTWGPWAYMCNPCYAAYGVGLGTGLGQEIVEEIDGSVNKLQTELRSVESRLEGLASETLKLQGRRETLRLRIAEIGEAKVQPSRPPERVRTPAKGYQCRHCNARTKAIREGGLPICDRCWQGIQEQELYDRIVDSIESEEGPTDAVL